MPEQKLNSEQKVETQLPSAQVLPNPMLSAAVSVGEGNKLIADFMGVKIGKELYSWRIGCTEPLKEEHLAYHSSWGWLMPVVEKISSIEFDRDEQELPFGGTEILIHTHYPRTFGMLNNSTRKPMFRYNCGQLFEADTLIEAAWLATVDFIKSYKEDEAVSEGSR